MSRGRELVWVFGMNGLQILASAVAFIRLARELEPVAYGLFSFAVAVASFLPLLAGVGADHVLVMQASRNEEKLSVLLGNAVVLRVITSTLLFLGLAVVVSLFGYSAGSVLLVISLAALLTAFAQPMLASYYRVIGRPRFVWAALAAGQVLFCALLFLPGVRVNLRWASWVYLASSVAVLVFLAIDVRRRIQLQFDTRLLRANLRLGAFFSASQLVDLGFQRMDVVLLQVMIGSAAVGMYAAGYKFVAVLLVVPSTLHVVHLPDFHRAAGAEDAGTGLASVFRGMRRVLLEISALLLGMVAVASDRLVAVFLGAAYAPAASIIVLGSIATLLAFTTYPYYMLAEAMDLVSQRFWLRCLATAVAAASVVGGILLLGLPGAALGMVVGSAVFLGLLHLLTRPVNGGTRALLNDLSPILPAIFSAGAVLQLEHLFGVGIVGLIWSSVVFATLFLVVGTMMRVLHFLDFRSLVARIARSE